MPSPGLCTSVFLHSLPLLALLLLGRAASEPMGAAPGAPGIEVAIAFGMPDATPAAEAPPEALPIPQLTPPPEPVPEPEVAETPEPPPPDEDVVLIEEPPPPEPAKIHPEPPKPVPPKPKPPKLVQKPVPPKPAEPAPVPIQVASTVGLPDAPKGAESIAPPSELPAAGQAQPGTSNGPSAPAEGGPLVIFDPAYREPPTPPAYPPRSVMLGQQGQVIVRAAIDAKGTPEEVVVWTSSGFPMLDKAAIDAVKRWRFMPARRGGNTVAAWVQVPVNFKLR